MNNDIFTVFSEYSSLFRSLFVRKKHHYALPVCLMDKEGNPITRKIYAFKNENGVVTYIGSTNNLRRREREHRYKEKLSENEKMVPLIECVSQEEGAYLEEKLIENMCTIKNIKKTERCSIKNTPLINEVINEGKSLIKEKNLSCRFVPLNLHSFNNIITHKEHDS